MDTYQYDYSYALTKDKVNDIMSTNLASVSMPLVYTDHDSVTGAVTNINVNLGVWSMADGGQNRLMKLNIPIKEGFMSISGLPGVNGSWDMTGVSLLVEITLGWLGPGNQQELDGEGSLTSLVFSPSEDSTSNDPGYIAILTVTDPSGQMTSAATGMLKQIAQQAFYENRDNLQYIFAGVVPVPAGATTWLRPYKWQYFVASGDIEALCFLSMLDDSPFPATPAFDSTALTSGCNAVALISQEAFFKNTLLPSVEDTFPKGTFAVHQTNQHSVISSNGSFDAQIDGDNINTDSFSLWPSDAGDGLQTSSAGGGPLTFLFGLADLPDATYSWTTKTVNPLSLNYSTGVMTFEEDPSPQTTHDQDIPWYDYIILVGLGLTLPGLIADITDAVNHYGDQVNAVGMSNINAAVQSTFDNDVVNVASLLDWQIDGQSFSLTEGGLDGALYFRGNLS
ncbi:TULIP family P47-like protein [Vreelandella alkaliphila]|uniref:TULIP family P47-like protein n=1 Tax=Vreelandella alkaliphila TaxID=272774 RepID=UPI003FD78CD7